MKSSLTTHLPRQAFPDIFLSHFWCKGHISVLYHRKPSISSRYHRHMFSLSFQDICSIIRKISIFLFGIKITPVSETWHFVLILWRFSLHCDLIQICILCLGLGIKIKTWEIKIKTKEYFRYFRSVC